MKSYKELEVWQESMTLAREVYLATRSFPREEMYGLSQQVRRAAVSVPSNIAEGHARESTKDFLRYLSIAMGSIAEAETQLELAMSLEFLSVDSHSKVAARADHVGRMLRGLQKSLKRKLEG